MVAIGCQAVGRGEVGFHRLATGGYGRRVATGVGWLRASGGYGRQVATGDGLSEFGAAGS